MNSVTHLTQKKPKYFQIPNYQSIVSESIEEEIRKVEYFAGTQYCNLKIAETLMFYTDRYVRQLLDFTTIDENTVIADIGAGFGWLSMAFAFSTEARVIAIEKNEDRLEAGIEIANILGIGHKIEWRTGALGELPLHDKEADVVYCIEVLEHVYKSTAALQDLARVSKNLLIFTTPNLWFPVIAHDTQLPFCHWLPIPVRKVYAKLFNRTHKENDNLFWSPLSIKKNTPDFKPISKWLHYSSYQNFKDTFPFYLPYGKGRYVTEIGAKKKLYYDIVSKLGIYSHWVLPSLSYVLERKSK